MDDLIEGVRREQEPAKRKAIFAEVQKMFIADGPVMVARLPIVRPWWRCASRFQGFVPHPSGWLDFRTTWLA